ncbi:acyl-CoA thioesterase [Photobacterium frigidiphilum]|uniref:Acyl-CoA thioesterase n=1 Tax=Photobacterium frigidiphilum TaxID=264736 RepID=A0A2T3J764_9GAMM|nr:thioesterase family protein [Photobacterium frigidiphilum]PSU44596.1 acyl-CoA thioesterase [Photobacterium frigidiphilum]
MIDMLKGYPVITEIPVAWGEMDALNHVNNVVYFRYMETARIDYFNKVQLMEDMKLTGVGPVLGETTCRYKLPVTFPDTLYVGSRVSEIKDDRFTMTYEIYSKKLNAITTVGSAKVVMFNFKNKKPDNLSQHLRDTIINIEGDALKVVERV